MTIQQTLIALKELAETPEVTSEDIHDDIDTALHIIDTCEPPLASAAVQHLMAQFMRRRNAANAAAL